MTREEWLRVKDVTAASLEEPFAGSRRESHSHHFEWDALFARVE